MTRGLQVGGVGDEGKDGLRVLHTALALNADSLYLVLNIRLPPNPQAKFHSLKIHLGFEGRLLTDRTRSCHGVVVGGAPRAVPSSVASTVMRAAGTASTFHLGFGSVE